MVYSGAEYSSEHLFHELLQQARVENIRSFDQYSELIDNLIEEKKSYGFLADEEDLIQLKRSLELRWPEIESNLDQ